MSNTYITHYRSEIGIVKITGTKEGISALDFVEEESTQSPEIPSSLERCVEQIDAYFRRKRRDFSLDLRPEGTDFQQRVWRQLLKIPFGKTVTYRDVASLIGNINAVRAVGNANGKNRISIIIPCHRVIGSDGKLTGYGGGLWRKEWLLRHELHNRTG